MPRFCTVPPPVPIDIGVPREGDAAPVIQFVASFRHDLSKSKVWRKDATTLGLFVDIDDKVRALAAGDAFVLEDDEHALIQEAVLTLDWGPLTPYAMRLFRPVLSAPKQRPSGAGTGACDDAPGKVGS